MNFISWDLGKHLHDCYHISHGFASFTSEAGPLIYADHFCKSYADVAERLPHLFCHKSESCIDTVVSCVIGFTGSIMVL